MSKCVLVVIIVLLIVYSTVLTLRQEGHLAVDFVGTVRSVDAVVSITNSSGTPPVSPTGGKFAVATYVDNEDHVYGLYSIYHQMKKFQMNVPLVTVTHEGFRGKKGFSVAQNISDEFHVVDRNHIIGRLGAGLWKGTFLKLFLFNLTSYDKVITLDQDVFLLKNIEHWFNYPTPAATQAKDNIEWNSGAMVISPNATLFQDLIDTLPRIENFVAHPPLPYNHTVPDKLTSGYSDQHYLSGYFTQKHMNFYTMPSENAVLSSSFVAPTFQYFVEHRLYLFNAIHFTVHKPWREQTTTDHPTLCHLLEEWKESVRGLSEDHGMDLQYDFLRRCPKR